MKSTNTLQRDSSDSFIKSEIIVNWPKKRLQRSTYMAKGVVEVVGKSQTKKENEQGTGRGTGGEKGKIA